MSVPSSPEVIAEEIQVQLSDAIPREEQGEFVRSFVREVAVGIAEVEQAWCAFMEDA